MKDIFGIRRRSAASPDSQQEQPEGAPIRSRAGVGLFVLLMLGSGLVGARAENVLLDEDFSRAAKGTFLEQSSEADWRAEEGRLIIGNGRALNGQALGYAPNRTWGFQVYSLSLNTTLAPAEAVEVSFSAAVKTDASPEFYNYALRLKDGDNYVQIQVKGTAEVPRVIVESMVGGVKAQSDVEGAYYEKSEEAGLVAVRMVVNGGSAQAYYDRSGKKEWEPVGDPVPCQLATIDGLLLRYYAMGFWSAMDDLKVAIVKPAP